MDLSGTAVAHFQSSLSFSFPVRDVRVCLFVQNLHFRSKKRTEKELVYRHTPGPESARFLPLIQIVHANP